MYWTDDTYLVCVFFNVVLACMMYHCLLEMQLRNNKILKLDLKLFKSHKVQNFSSKFVFFFHRITLIMNNNLTTPFF